VLQIKENGKGDHKKKKEILKHGMLGKVVKKGEGKQQRDFGGKKKREGGRLLGGQGRFSNWGKISRFYGSTKKKRGRGRGKTPRGGKETEAVSRRKGEAAWGDRGGSLCVGKGGGGEWFAESKRVRGPNKRALFS